MDHASTQQRIMGLFADILDYPAPGLADKAGECVTLVGTAAPAAVTLLDGFRSFSEQTSLGKLQEVYSSFFDLSPLCHPYVGYQLFGENYKRSVFLLALKQRYRAEAFEASTSEIADRLSIVLRFVSLSKAGKDTGELVREGLLPAVNRMTTTPESSDHDHDEHSEFDGDTGVERKQLDGHSDGEELAGGFLLEVGADEHGTESGEKRPHPYHQALEALRVVLHETCHA